MVTLSWLAGLAVSGGVTVEELAERLERLEKKVEAYEDRYGPLEGEGPLPWSMQRRLGEEPPASSGGSEKGGMDPTSDDAINESFGAGGGVYSGGDNWWERTTLGGYGEMHLTLGDKEEIDFHRWVLFLNHRFNDRISLVSELELEHSVAGEGKNGEVELEQAYIDFAIGRGVHAKGGVFLLPLGFLNEVHEPVTFFGTERNPIEAEIIPTTWWEGGAALTQTTENGFQWDLALHSGLNVPTEGSNAYRIRSGRQKVSEAPAQAPAVTGRVRYTGLPGLDVSVFGQFQEDITQESGTEDNSAWFGGATVGFQRGGFGFRGLVGYWNIDGDEVAMMDRDEQWGFYVEPSYTIPLGEESKVGIFGRYNWYDYARGEVSQYDVGLNYWPIDDVVLKADYSHIDPESSGSDDHFNLGIGYQF